MSELKDNHNRGGLIAFVFSMAFVFAFFFYTVFVHKGIDLGEKVVDPNAPVISVDGKPVFDISKVSEPWVTSEDMIAHGKKVYSANCAMCHGANGAGDGAAGQGLNPKPRNLIEGKWKKGGGLIGHFKVLQEGIPGGSMASYAHLKVADRWALSHFIESITQDKGSDTAQAVADFAKTAK